MCQAQHLCLKHRLQAFSVAKTPIRTTSPSAALLLTQYNLSDAGAPRPPDVYATHTAAMASGKKSALLSSLADYGDDSEPDSDPEGEEAGTLFLRMAAKIICRCANLSPGFHVAANVSLWLTWLVQRKCPRYFKCVKISTCS